ncbi:hypothetical protein [Pedobacter sp. KLB.chiD]|uniref:hypothetical protein n=1 Tax=Pedobacter sp. KLB.chiD TaxID=3387402 RepID=UPI00399C3C33
MRKLTLKSNAFNKGEVLTREQLKKVMGAGTCQVFLPNTPSGGTNLGGMNWGGSNGAPYSSMVHGTSGTVISGVSSADAQRAVSNGGRWCCDSCGSAPWALPTPV